MKRRKICENPETKILLQCENPDPNETLSKNFFPSS